MIPHLLEHTLRSPFKRNHCHPPLCWYVGGVSTKTAKKCQKSSETYIQTSSTHHTLPPKSFLPTSATSSRYSICTSLLPNLQNLHPRRFRFVSEAPQSALSPLDYFPSPGQQFHSLTKHSPGQALLSLPVGCLGSWGTCHVPLQKTCRISYGTTGNGMMGMQFHWVKSAPLSCSLL